MTDPDHQTNYHLNRDSLLGENRYDHKKLEDAERPGKLMRILLRKNVTSGYVYGTDNGHNNGPFFNAQPNDTSDPRHASYGTAYSKVF